MNIHITFDDAGIIQRISNRPLGELLPGEAGVIVADREPDWRKHYVVDGQIVARPTPIPNVIEEQKQRRIEDRGVLEIEPILRALMDRRPAEVSAWVEENITTTDPQAKEVIRALAMAVSWLMKRVQ